MFTTPPYIPTPSNTPSQKKEDEPLWKKNLKIAGIVIGVIIVFLLLAWFAWKANQDRSGWFEDKSNN
jgi:predicted negative regulator of RcsB-dependent stress response